MSYPVILDHESLIDVELDEPIPIGQDLLRSAEPGSEETSHPTLE